MANYNCRLCPFFSIWWSRGGGRGPSSWGDERPGTSWRSWLGPAPRSGRGLAGPHSWGPLWTHETRPCRHAKGTLGSCDAVPVLFCCLSLNCMVGLPPALLPAWVPISVQTIRGRAWPERGRFLEHRRAGRQEERLSGLSMVTSLWAPDSNCGVIKLNSTI